MDRAEENKSTTYVDIRGDGMLQPLPKRGKLARKILTHTTERQKQLVIKSMVCEHLYDSNRCRVGNLCEPKGCLNWSLAQWVKDKQGDRTMSDEWKYIGTFDITDDVNVIHCDTRDFHCICHTAPLDTKDGKHREITKRYYNKAYQIKADKIIDWLKCLESMSGGESKWRMLCFDNVSCKGWLKYIRMYRNPKDRDYFVVCNSYNTPITWEQCTEENLHKDDLYTW